MPRKPFFYNPMTISDHCIHRFQSITRTPHGMGSNLAIYWHLKWSRRILNPFLKAPICLILQGLPNIVHALIHACNFQPIECQKICVGHVRVSIELYLNRGFSKATLGSSFTLN